MNPTRFLSLSLALTAFFLGSQACGSQMPGEENHLAVVRQSALSYLNYQDFAFHHTFERQKMEYRLLVAPYTTFTRKQFIEEGSNPCFYSVSFKNSPLNIFILPTIHTLPQEALPLHIRRAISQISDTEGSQLFPEVTTDDYYEEDIDADEEPIDPRYTLNIETAVARDVTAFTRMYKHIYVKKGNNLERFYWDEKIKSLQYNQPLIYKQGWVKQLKPPIQAILMESENPERLNKIDPLYLYRKLRDVESRDSRPSYYQLDDVIEDTFKRKQRIIRSLENETDRDEAEDEAAFHGSEEEEDYHLDTTLYLLEPILFRLKQARSFDASEQHIPSLDEVNLANPMILSYLRGEVDLTAPSSIDIGVRNKKWWEGSIAPLLQERVSLQKSSRSVTPLPPILFIYGAAHNEGPYSILRKIQEELSGFNLSLLTRKGFIPLPQSQIHKS